MSTVALDRLLAFLVVALAASGLVSLRAGTPSQGWLFVVHGVLGGALVVAVVVKLRRSLPPAVRARRWRRVAVGSAVAVAALLALAGGFAWVASGRILTLGPWTFITLHAIVGLVLVPLVLVHLHPHRWRLLSPRAMRRPVRRDPAAATSPPRGLSRRTIVAAGVFGIAATGLWGAAEVLDRLRGGERRFTGSRWLPSGGIPPPTTFFGEPVPSVDVTGWRLSVRGRVARTIALDLDGLRALGESDAAAVLDCTGGWAIETAWRGVPVRRLLDAAGAADGSDVVVRSVTGWSARLRPEDVDRSMLATGVAGQDLPLANGAPCRLVIPDRRGLDWVKWATDVEVV